MKNNIQGVGVALVTPFISSGKVDFAALEHLVTYVTQGGVDYLVALGTTAETATLNCEEKQNVLECIKQSNRSDLPIVIGIGGNNTAQTVRDFSDFDLKGVDAILSVTPYYNKPSQAGLFEHYRCLAAESPLPIILYNVPSRTGVNMTAETTLRLAHEIQNIIGIKEACGSLNQMAYLLRDRPAGFKVICGDDGLAMPLAAMGGDGVISVAANVFPREFSQMLKAVDNHNLAAASTLHIRLLEVVDTLFDEGNPTGIKAALAIKGIINNYLRLPLVPSSERLWDKLRLLMEKYEL